MESFEYLDLWNLNKIESRINNILQIDTQFGVNV